MKINKILWITLLVISTINIGVAIQQNSFINGTVMDSFNKTVIADVTVSTNTNLSTKTNAMGFYSFAVTAGAYNLTAKFEPTYYVNNTITVSTIGSENVVQDIELLKKPVGTITGKVRTASSITPGTPANLANTTGNFWINHTWSAGSGIVTDSYNVSVNGQWRNGTSSTFNNSSVLPHGWSNISVWSYNNSGGLSSAPAIRETRLANNNPVQTTIGNKVVTAGNVLTFTVSVTDADSDTITYRTNATKGTLNSATGVYSWTTAASDAGTFIWTFNSSDNYGGVASETITVNVTDGQGVWIDLTNNSGELTVNDSSSLGDLSSATWNIWALQNQYTLNAGLFGKYQASSGKRSYIIRTSGSEISIVLSGDGNITETLSSGCGLQNNNEWTMITVAYNGTHITFYRNGQKCTSKPTSIRALKNAPVPLRIGGGNNIFFNGSIDDTLIFDKELPAHQIYRLLQESEHGLAGRQSIPVILYHQLKDPADESDKVTVNNFEQQIAYLHNNNFTTITPENFYQWQKDNFTMPERPVIIYFDDGWSDVYDHALPILKQYGYAGTVALVAYYADQMSYGDWTGYMTWDQLRELQNNGWEIASHGFEHLHMTSLSEAEFRYQLNYSREEIENELGRKPTSFVFPYHDANIPYTAICGEYYDLCWTYGSRDTFPYYTLYTDDGHAYQGLKRITIYNTTTMQTFQKMFAREVYNPVGAWPLNEGTGNIAYDSSGNNNNAILNANAKWHFNGKRMLIPQLPPSIKPMPLPPTETLS